MIYGQNPQKESRPVQTDTDGRLIVVQKDSTGADATGAKITAAAMPAGGSGILGWLSAVWYQLTSGETAVKSGGGSTVTATISNGQTLSAAVDLGNQRLGRIGCPASVDGNTTLSFMTSHDGVTYRALFDAYGTEYTVTIAANRSVVPDLTMFAAARYLKVRFGKSTAAGTAATADRSFDLSTLA